MGGGHSDRSTPKRTWASLDVVAAGKARGIAAAEEARTAAAEDFVVGAAAAKTAAAGKAIAGGAAAAFVSAGAASVEIVTAGSARRAVASEGAVWETATLQEAFVVPSGGVVVALMTVVGPAST